VITGLVLFLFLLVVAVLLFRQFRQSFGAP
jgi:hypothetical protein